MSNAEWAIMAALLLMAAILATVEYGRFLRPRTVRMEQAARLFTGAPEVEIALGAAGLDREALARVAHRHGYAYDTTERRGRTLYFRFRHHGPCPAPAPFLPESPHYDAYAQLESGQLRRFRLLQATLLLLAAAVAVAIILKTG